MNIRVPDRSDCKISKPTPFAELLAAAFEPLEDAITIANPDGFIIAANPAFERIYGWPLKDVVGFHPIKFCPDLPRYNWDKLAKKIWKKIDQKGLWEGLVINHDKSGNEFPIVLKTRVVQKGKEQLVLSFARKFPKGTPWGLGGRALEVFNELGKGTPIKSIGDKFKPSEGPTRVQPGTQLKWVRAVCKVIFSPSESPKIKNSYDLKKAWSGIKNRLKDDLDITDLDQEVKECLKQLRIADEASLFMQSYQPTDAGDKGSTVRELIKRLKDYIKVKTYYSQDMGTDELQRIAVICHHMGWDASKKLENTEILEHLTNKKKKRRSKSSDAYCVTYTAHI